MENNNDSRKYSHDWYEAFRLEDTRYYGVFIKGRNEERHILVDPKRYQKIFNIPEEMKKVMDIRKGPLFHPAKERILDYNVNFMLHNLAVIKREWAETHKLFINRFLSEITGKNYNLCDDDLFQCGIVDATEAADNARMATLLSHEYAKFKRENLYYSLYAQYFHQMASQIDAIILKTLMRNGYKGDKFNRNVFYTFKGQNKESIRSLDGFAGYEKMYAVWNFIKHNSLSTYDAVKDNFPVILKEGEYKQGELACFHVNFADDLIDSILTGEERFFKEYCRLVFGEDAREASWNSEEYFRSIVYGEIDEIQDPFGLRFRI
jgi:hypothetical protein